ncbi:MAG: mechanosensitive ion channel [Bacteroidales bacterium]|nr:mechanosensitive ion channel [Bacteroidales bacterium]
MQQLMHDAIQFGLKVLAALAIYVIGAWLIRRVKKLLQRSFTRKGTDRTIASFVTSFTSVSLTLLLVVLTIGALGVNTTSLAALLAAGGMAIGMALSGTVQNFAGGLMLLAFKPFKVGDFIEAQGYSGTVTDMSIVSTRLTLPDNRSVSLPNGALSNGTINNFTRNLIRRVEWTVAMEYGTDAEACEAMLLSLADDPRILDSKTPGAADPFTALSALNESSVVFILRAWVKNEDYWGVYFSINNRIYQELPKAGFRFPYPQLDIHISPKS